MIHTSALYQHTLNGYPHIALRRNLMYIVAMSQLEGLAKELEAIPTRPALLLKLIVKVRNDGYDRQRLIKELKSFPTLELGLFAARLELGMYENKGDS